MKPLILYHAGCYDGFGGAYAAWKKYGANARFIAAENHSELPTGIDGADVTIIDFCFTHERMQELQRRAKSVMVLDHHQTNADYISSNPTWRYSDQHSGCTLAWGYFHPDTPTPLFLRYLQDSDTWNFSLPDSKLLKHWLHSLPMQYELWDSLVDELERPERVAHYTEKARMISQYFDFLADIYERNAKLVEFEGHQVLAVQAPAFLRSEIGHRLAVKHPPFGIVWRYQDAGLRFSLRGDGSIDVGIFAVKHGGGGHHNAASFFVPCSLPLPFKSIHE